MSDAFKCVALVTAVAVAAAGTWLINRRLANKRQMRQLRWNTRALSQLLRECALTIKEKLARKDPQLLWLEVGEWLVRGAAENSTPRDALRYLLGRLNNFFLSCRTPLLPVDERLTGMIWTIFLSIRFRLVPPPELTGPDQNRPPTSCLEAEKVRLSWALCTALDEIDPVASMNSIMAVCYGELLNLVPSADQPVRGATETVTSADGQSDAVS